MSLEQLAERAGTTTSSLQRLEAGETALCHESLSRIADALDISVADVLGLNEPEAELEADLFKVADAISSRIKMGEGVQAWEVASPILNAIGIEPGDIVTVHDVGTDGLSMGDPLVFTIRDDHTTPKEGALLRQFIEPNLLITNSNTKNFMPISMKTHNVEIIGLVSTKVFRPYTRKPCARR